MRSSIGRSSVVDHEQGTTSALAELNHSLGIGNANWVRKQRRPSGWNV